jgi:hypothetical protein
MLRQETVYDEGRDALLSAGVGAYNMVGSNWIQ